MQRMPLLATAAHLGMLGAGAQHCSKNKCMIFVEVFAAHTPKLGIYHTPATKHREMTCLVVGP